MTLVSPVIVKDCGRTRAARQAKGVRLHSRHRSGGQVGIISLVAVKGGMPSPCDCDHDTEKPLRRLGAPISRLFCLRVAPALRRLIVRCARLDPARALRGLLFFPERRLGLEVVHDELAGGEAFATTSTIRSSGFNSPTRWITSASMMS